MNRWLTSPATRTGTAMTEALTAFLAGYRRYRALVNRGPETMEEDWEGSPELADLGDELDQLWDALTAEEMAAFHRIIDEELAATAHGRGR